MNDQRKILEQIENGEISVEEGVKRLEALTSEPVAEEEATEERVQPTQQDERIILPSWVDSVRNLLLWLAISVTAIGGWMLTTAYSGEAPPSRMTWGWIVLILGALGVLFGWWLQRAHWMFVRVRNSDGPNVTIPLPLPLAPLAWFLRVFGPHIPQLEGTGVDELLLSLRDELHAGNPFIVQVDEGDEGEHVEVYFV